MTRPPALRPFFIVAGAAAAADQAIKLTVASRFHLGESIALIPGYLSITYIRNRGAVFGVLASHPGDFIPVFFIATTLGALAFVFYLYRYSPSAHAYGRHALMLIFGGGLGNLVDRIAYGEVIDFIDVYYGSYHWPAFNLADSCISVGVALLALDLLRSPRE